jgi:hypothetical protein
MKIILIFFLLIPFLVMASPFITVKDQLRVDLWKGGLMIKPMSKSHENKILPEEIERPLRKI